MNKEFLIKIMDLLLDTVCAVDEEGRFVYLSASCFDLLGYTPDELIGRNMAEFVHPEDLERTEKAATEVAVGRPPLFFENRYIHKDGHVVDLRWSGQWSEKERLRLGVARNITSLKRAERMQAALYRISEAGQTAESLPKLCKSIHVIINELLPLRNFSVILYQPEAQTISIPYCVGDVACVDESAPTRPPQALDPDSLIASVILSGESRSTRLSEALASGAQNTCAPCVSEHMLSNETAREWLGVPLAVGHTVIGALVVQGGVDAPEYQQKDKDLLQFVSTQIASAIERKQVEARLRHMAGHDALTDLPNRNLFQDRLEVALRRAQRDREYLGVLYVDLDDFKVVNDRYGHQAGDLLLCEIAARMKRCLRASDTVARMGGDEFTVILANLRGPDSLKFVTKKLKDALELPFSAVAADLMVSASIGAALYPDHGANGEQLLQFADKSMYLEKRSS